MKTTTMKTKLTITALFAITAVFFLSCDNPVGLGAMLDLEGPLVEFKSPAPRQALLAEFDIEGIVSDKSGVDRMLLTAETTEFVSGEYETVTYAKQWRYEKGKWEVSENNGTSWAALSGGRATGPAPGRAVTNAEWSVPIDMRINGTAKDGIYLFKIQAWDSGGFTGDSSTKTIVLIIDQYPPKVSVIDPYIYNRQSYSPATNTFIDADLAKLHGIADNNKGESRTSSNIGLFMTRDFNLKWQIDDEYDIGSIDIYFCDYDTDIDGIPETPIVNNKIYYTYHEDSPKPNGLTRVPNLTAQSTPEDKDGTIVKPITQKTTIMVVGVCKDMATNESENEEKILGYFVYWPKADEPWIEYPSKMDDPDEEGYFTDPNKNKVDYLKDMVLMVYPERSIKPAAYQAHGVSKVRYALYQCEEARDDPDSPTSPTNPIRLTGVLKQPYYYESVNKPREIGENQILSTNFTWEITAPSRPGYYVVKAIPYGPEGSIENNESDEDFEDVTIEKFTALFRVQDISFPEFLPGYPLPSATDPLFKFIGRPEADGEPNTVPAGSIRISGKVDDAVQITSLLMVWINPASRNYSAMSQLRYFSDPAYEGWNDAAKLAEGNNTIEDDDDNSDVENYPYDKNNRNRLWKLELPTVAPGLVEDPDTYRKVYTYSQIIDLAADLNIGAEAGKNPLKSQMFLLRAQNPDGKATVITYAPQGDAAVPTIKITNVQVGGVTYTPSEGFTQIPQFLDADSPAKVITVNGTWKEDSTEYLDNWTYFYNNMKFSINGVTIQRNAAGTDWVDGNGTVLDNTNIQVDITPPTGAYSATEGTFKITATVGTEISSNTLKTSHLRDTLVVNASVRDYGGNPAEDGASWLIESDKLRFLRISSLAEDRAYRAGEAIDIFIEFNKPVVFKYKANNSVPKPVLLVNATGSNTTTGTAAYKVGQDNEATRHYFTYTVGANDTTDRLNVTGISIDGGSNALSAASTAWQSTNYPFTFVHTNIDNTKEEVRLTMDPTHVTNDTSRNGKDVTSQVTPAPPQNEEVFARLVPVSANNDITANPDYIYTLAGGKAISVDTTAPTITGFTASPAGWHGAGVDLYITATFSEPVKLGTTRPRLTLGYTNNNTTIGQTIDSADDVRVNNDQITFRYRVAAGDSTGNNPLRVTAFSGDILDIPGNELNALTPTTLGTNAQTYLYLDTTAPDMPTIAVYSGTAPTGTQITGTNNALGTLYEDNVFIRITATGTTGDNINLGKVEYSLNGGQNWTSSTTAITNIQASNKGTTYQVSVRQTDQAGNESGTSDTTTFTWDPGALITRISSTSANGTYTHISNSTNGNVINVTVTFRKPLTFAAGTPTITHNAKTTGNTLPTTSNLANATNTLSFTYTVANGDATPTTGATQVLDVTNISGFTTVRDGTAEVNVTRYLNGVLPAAAGAKLAENKQIKVETGNLTRESIAFKTTSNAGVPTLDTYDTNNGWSTNEATAGAKYQGIRSDDGSYWTTLEIQFNHGINKGSGDITITQIPGTGNTAYRLPAVLTEAQYNRFRGIANFNTYYTKGTNGYIYNSTTPANSRSDTSAKYVLNYQYNPSSAVTTDNSAYQGDRYIPAAFFTAFRAEEAISINVNSQAVEIPKDTNGNNTNILKIRLTGASAPQVPGATYLITYPAGLVNDSLGNTSAAATDIADNRISLGGVAKPFVRIRKTQDTIAARQTGSTTAPNFAATQPRLAYVRMDSRTPNATIQYTANDHTYTATNNNWSTSTGPNYDTTAVISGGTTITNPNNGVTLNRPGTPGTTFNNNNNNMQIPANGTTAATAIIGYKWWVRARATSGNYTSLETEEMAYRTAITYRLRAGGVQPNNTGADMADPLNSGQGSEVTSGQQRVGQGDQIWIRGGDAIGSSTIPGFPFTWEDDWTSFQENNKRAGIRLMSLRGSNSTPTTTGTASLNNSTWEFMTWDMNATAYVDFILGRDGTTTGGTVTLGSAEYTASNNNQVWQYGPRLWAYHRGGWTGLNTQYPIYPGEHRWLDIGQQVTAAVPINFSSVFNSRPELTAYNGANTN